MRSSRLFVLVGVLLLTPACVSPTGPRDTLGWLEARGADLMDIVGVRVAVGAGLGAYARVTEYVQLGFMLRGPSERDIPTPNHAELRSVPCFMFGTIGRYGGAWFESTHEFMLPAWSSRDEPGTAIAREVLAGYVSPQGEEDLWRESVGVGAHFLLVGVELEVRPYQIFDFLGGLIGYDPSADDVPVDLSPSDEDSDDS